MLTNFGKTNEYQITTNKDLQDSVIIVITLIHFTEYSGHFQDDSFQHPK